MRRKALDILYGHDLKLYAEVKQEVEKLQQLLEDDEEWVSVDAAHRETGLSKRKISRLAKDGEWKAYKAATRFPTGCWRVVIPRELKKQSRSTPSTEELLDVPKETRGLSNAIIMRWPMDEKLSAVCLGWYTVSGNGNYQASAVKQIIKAEALAERCDFYPVWYGYVDQRGAQLLRLLSDRLKHQAKQAGKLGVALAYPQLGRRIMIAFEQSSTRIDNKQLLELKPENHLLSQDDLNSVRELPLSLMSSDDDVKFIRYSNGKVALVDSNGNTLLAHQ